MENNALRACIESKTVKKKIQISSPIPLFSNREFQNQQFSIKVQNQPPNFWKSPGWNLAIKSFKSSRKFNNTITLKTNKACWSFTFLRNQTIYAITLSTAIISYEAINIHSVVPRTLTKTIIKKAIRKTLAMTYVSTVRATAGSHRQVHLYWKLHFYAHNSSLSTANNIQYKLECPFQRRFSHRLKVILNIKEHS